MTALCVVSVSTDLERRCSCCVMVASCADTAATSLATGSSPRASSSAFFRAAADFSSSIAFPIGKKDGSFRRIASRT
jgi:hypothetical protein